MKKITGILFSLVLLLQTFNVPTFSAQTLGQLKQELQEKQTEYNNNENKKNLTQAQINTTKSEISNIQNSISQTFIDISNLDKEIEILNNNIIEKDKQMKEVLNYTQVSNGESAYLEYAFGATDFTDFIYRVAISEQLTQYNENLIAEYNKTIEESKKKQEELTTKRTELETKQKSLQSKMESLGSELNSVTDISVSIKDEISLQKELIELYESKGCKDTDDIRTCGRAKLPSGTALYRPIESGYVTSFYGNRTYDGWHYGIDVSTSVTAVPVYSSGNGMVSGIWRKFYCGGNMIFIQHKINGNTYTTLYAHLLSINVNVGDMVTRTSVIGYMGGGYNTTTSGGGWDSPACTTGQHLHFQIATGLFGDEYTSWAAFSAHTFDPTNIINFPSNEYSWFTDRITAY